MPRMLTDVTPEKGGRRDWRWAFLGMLARSACVSVSCHAAGVSRQTAYRHRDRFPKFRRKWDEALAVAVELLEAEARLRAFDRKDPASATMIIFLLKAHKPGMYRDNARADPGEPDRDVSQLTDDELRAIIEAGRRPG